MELYYNRTRLTKESILKTRKFYRDNCYDYIDSVKLNPEQIYCDKEYFYKMKESEAEDYMSGKNDGLMSFLQMAYYIQTGESVPLISF